MAERCSFGDALAHHLRSRFWQADRSPEYFSGIHAVAAQALGLLWAGCNDAPVLLPSGVTKSAAEVAEDLYLGELFLLFRPACRRRRKRRFTKESVS